MTEQSPVVPSVGAVPVEVPEETVEELRKAVREAERDDDGTWLPRHVRRIVHGSEPDARR